MKKRDFFLNLRYDFLISITNGLYFLISDSFYKKNRPKQNYDGIVKAAL